jgi:hypothetical protein
MWTDVLDIIGLDTVDSLVKHVMLNIIYYLRYNIFLNKYWGLGSSIRSNVIIYSTVNSGYLLKQWPNNMVQNVNSGWVI